MILSVGNDDWPCPVPVVKRDGPWRFDANEGKQELLARRIGKNELSTIQFCLAYVDAQREYALKDRDGDGLLEYAQKFRSDPGKKTACSEGEGRGEAEPPGSIAAAAHKEGYSKTGEKPTTLHGYYYRILTGQGKNAPGGAYDYVVKGNMIGGFALVAYPAKYAASGIMTFMVNHDGVVYQKDLGKDTEKTAQAINASTRTAPGKRWNRTALTPKREVHPRPCLRFLRGRGGGRRTIGTHRAQRPIGPKSNIFPVLIPINSQSRVLRCPQTPILRRCPAGGWRALIPSRVLHGTGLLRRAGLYDSRLWPACRGQGFRAPCS